MLRLKFVIEVKSFHASLALFHRIPIVSAPAFHYLACFVVVGVAVVVVANVALDVDIFSPAQCLFGEY